MSFIRCSLSKEGKLIVTAVEFEPGDIIHFKSDQPVRVEGQSSAGIEVRFAFGLNEMVAAEKADGLNLNVARAAVSVKSPPPNPPGVTPITIYVAPSQKQPAGTHQQAAGKS